MRDDGTLATKVPCKIWHMLTACLKFYRSRNGIVWKEILDDFLQNGGNGATHMLPKDWAAALELVRSDPRTKHRVPQYFDREKQSQSKEVATSNHTQYNELAVSQFQQKKCKPQSFADIVGNKQKFESAFHVSEEDSEEISSSSCGIKILPRGTNPFCPIGSTG